ncbi:MAG: phosphate signaling complex protein PhoU [Clostridiales bacterium]|nr:phosphate signaling complex protein PhoU [Clostridiales bacterium]
MRSRFDEQLALLNKELITMGALCENAIALSVKALLTGDMTLAKKVRQIETEIDDSEKTIESICMKLLLHQQPVARDLRQISAALKLITDMERIGDQAADIAEIVQLANIRADEETVYIGDMARATIKMVTDSVDAYVNRDPEMAQKVIDYDDVVDDLFNKVKQSLITSIEEKQINGEYAIDLLMIAKYFERIGDHAVNIAEWVLFSITGVHKGEAAL